MKRPQPVKGKYIPRKSNRSQSSSNGWGLNRDVKELLGNLDGKQLQQVASDVISGTVNLANNALSYGKEIEKTKQIYEQCQADILKAEKEVEKVREVELTKREQIRCNTKKNSDEHIENMQAQTQSHTIIKEILKQVEEGKVSPEHLAEIISAVK
ncbi:hypothetical protein [Vibrio furnissii]|uniref:hypothetical protein n=1 Tax=Vibrio furnissii TaxID=29494 RepID=UPI001C9D1E44|nr:hypothetical protein [Vibrio furnissii]MBY8100747.1 hypothetical protein [Vibrio fluvialis]MCG6233027.1 hypothetical protein [Vibrio furnissii]MCG6258876.1 hypothetical protein [Vibrio furnissii]